MPESAGEMQVGAASDVETGSITSSSPAANKLPDMDRFIDRPLCDPQGEELGHIRDTVTTGDERHFVVGYGDFYGGFERKALVPFNDVREDGNERLVASISRAELEDMPAY